jgi:tRNA nucleotidyltransferase/poly(A) polymerase
MARAADPVLAREAATAIVRVLRQAGHVAYFAGGCVRDELLSLRPTDFDVATDAVPARVRELFPKTAEVGAAFGVVLVYEKIGTERAVIEVATFRSDGPYSDARRPDSVHFSTPEEDAKRRDFTINALFLDPLLEPGTPGRVIDFVGGQQDLAARLIRAVGEPEKRLAEDHLRALRAVRFAARLGFMIEPGTAAAISRHAAELRGVSRERIGEEMRRMLLHPSPVCRMRAVELIERLGLDAPVLQEEARGPGSLSAVGRQDALAPIMGSVLAAWCIERMGAGGAGLDERQIAEVRARWRGALCLSNEESTDFSDVLEIYSAFVRDWGMMGVARRKRLAARAMFAQALGLLRAVDAAAAERISGEVKGLDADGIGISPQPLVTGEDLIAMGLRPGPAFKRILDGVTDAQLEGRVRTKAEAMELAGRMGV